MKKKDAIKTMGSQSALAEALGVTRQAVNAWGANVPERYAANLVLLTDGAIKVSASEIQAWRAHAAILMDAVVVAENAQTIAKENGNG